MKLREYSSKAGLGYVGDAGLIVFDKAVRALVEEYTPNLTPCHVVDADGIAAYASATTATAHGSPMDYPAKYIAGTTHYTIVQDPNLLHNEDYEK